MAKRTNSKRSQVTSIEIEEHDLPWVISVQIAEVDGITQIVGLQLAPPEGADVRDCIVTVERLRALPLRELQRQAGHVVAGGYAHDRPVYQREGRRLPAEHWLDVAAAYGVAVEAGLPPIKFIAEYMGAPRGTAAKWVRRARELGYLGRPAQPRQVGGAPTTPPRGSPRQSQRER